MQRLKIKNADKIIFIENKANYIDYIQNKINDDEFVVYHGGMYSPVKGTFFRKLYVAAKEKSFYHWSDIDMGGFRIFVRLKEIIPPLKKYKMSKQDFYKFQKYWKKVSVDYINKLEEMRKEKKYIEFYDVMDEILKSGCVLEQEAFI